MAIPKRYRRTIRQSGPDPIDVQVGRRLREARHLAGYNQTDLANALGVSFQAVQKYEGGDNRLSASRLFAAAQTLGFSVSFFFYGIGSSNEEGADGRVTLDGKEIELIRALRLISGTPAHRWIVELIKYIGPLRSEHSHKGGRRSA